MGIRVTCPQCNRELNVKSFLAGKRGVCPDCKTKFDIPAAGSHNIVLEVEESEVAPTARRPAPVSQQAVGAIPSPAGTAPMMAPLSHPGPATPATIGPVATVAMPALPIASATAPLPAAVPADPIAQAPHAAWHIAMSTGQRHGPIAGDVLRQWIAEGRIAADSLVWRDGWPQWLPAANLFAELSAQPNAYMPVSAATMAAAPPVVFPASEAAALTDAFPTEPRRVSRARTYGRRSQSSRTAIMVILILAVLILAPLLGYVLVQQF